MYPQIFLKRYVFSVHLIFHIVQYITEKFLVFVKNKYLPVIYSLNHITVFIDKKKRGYFTIMGDKPGECARRLADAGADVIGANCTLTAPEMVELAKILVDESPVPVLIQPNAGQPEIVDGQAVYRVTPEKFAEDVGKILATGVAAVGGCCGTTPEHIRAVAELMRHEYNSSQD